MAIPLREGLQIRCGCQCTPDEGKELMEKVKNYGSIRQLNQQEHERQTKDGLRGWFGGRRNHVGVVANNCCAGQ